MRLVMITCLFFSLQMYGFDFSRLVHSALTDVKHVASNLKKKVSKEHKKLKKDASSVDNDIVASSFAHDVDSIGRSGALKDVGKGLEDTGEVAADATIAASSDDDE